MRRSDWAFLAVIVTIALGLRVWAPWGDVFGAERVNFLETDAWYHIRLLESQVRNFPHHITVDPYASPDPQYVAVAPLLDTIVATVVVATRGTGAGTAYVERVAALAPPIMGVFAVIAIWALATDAFGRREGLLAAFLAAILPGHFLDRTLVGFVDHHALEACLLFSVLATVVAAIRCVPTSGALPTSGAVPTGGAFPTSSALWAIAAGVCLGFYLLTWTSGALFVAMLAAWLITLCLFANAEDVVAAASTTAILAVVALALVLVFQDPRLYRYSMQVASLVGLGGIAAGIALLAPRLSLVTMRVSIVAGVVLMAGVATILAPGFTGQVLFDVMRLNPDPERMSVLEARPLFLYAGNWQWSQPWVFFRSGFYLGAVAVVGLAGSVWRSRRSDHWLIVIITVSMFAATVGQNRFGYYLVPACAVVVAWLSVRVLDWGGVPHAGNRSPQIHPVVPMQRELAVILVAGLAVAPNLAPAALTTARSGGMPGYWADVMEWLRTETPLPFSSDDYYLQRYDPAKLQTPSYSVMNWWDQGYWIVQTAHRVPAANPTQANARDVARFYVATEEGAALAAMAGLHARYAIVDWELPFRELSEGALGGRFENLVGWAGRPKTDFYQLCYTKAATGWQYTWLFREAYYQTMAYRLTVLGGAAASPVNNTWVVRTDDRVDATGRHFCEASDRQVYPSADEAQSVAQRKGAGYQAVGLTPWQPAFSTPAITGLRLERDFRKAGQPLTEAPMARVFEITNNK